MKWRLLAVIINCILVIGIIGCVAGKTIKLEIPSGTKVESIYYGTPGIDKRPAVLIFPGVSGLRTSLKSDYYYFAKWLNEKYNFNVLVIDYRAKSMDEVPRIEWLHGSITYIKQEVATALEYLRKQESVDKEKIGLIGFSYGTFLSVMTASREDTVRVLVLVSTVKTSRNWEMAKHFPAAATRPILFIASKGDYIPNKGSADEIALYWSNLAKSNTKVEIVKGGLHSVKLIRVNKLKNMVGDWLEKYLVSETE